MAWNTYKIKSTGLTVSQNPPMTSISEVNGEVAVAYTMEDELYFSIYNSSTHLWTETYVRDGLAPKCEIKLVETNGKPGIFYYHPTLNQFRFIISADTSGLSWDYDVEVRNSTVSVSDEFSIGLTYEESRMIVSFIGDASSTTGQYSNACLSMDDNGLSWSSPLKITTETSGGSGTKILKYATDSYIMVGDNGSDIIADSSSVVNVESSLSSPKAVLLSDISSYIDVYYTSGTSLKYKRSSNGGGTSWPASSTTLFSFSSSSGTKKVAGIEEGSSVSFIYRGSSRISYYNGFNSTIVSTSSSVGNFGMVQIGTNILGSYYLYNSSASEYEVWVVSEQNLEAPNSSSSSSEEESQYAYAYFDGGSNVLNAFGNMISDTFVLPEAVNTCVMCGFSGDNLHTLKLEDVDRSVILCSISHYSIESSFLSVPAGSMMRFIIDGGSPGDVVNSYEVKFRFSSVGSSSTQSESFSSKTSGSSISSDSSDSSSSDSSSSDSSSSDSSSSDSSSSDSSSSDSSSSDSSSSDSSSSDSSDISSSDSSSSDSSSSDSSDSSSSDSSDSSDSSKSSSSSVDPCVATFSDAFSYTENPLSTDYNLVKNSSTTVRADGSTAVISTSWGHAICKTPLCSDDMEVDLNYGSASWNSKSIEVRIRNNNATNVSGGCYFIRWDYDDELRLYRYSGGQTVIASNTVAGFNPTSVHIEAVGSAISATLNGNTVSATDSVITTGKYWAIGGDSAGGTDLTMDNVVANII